MYTENTVTVEEKILLRNAYKTFNYLFEAFCDQDFVSAKLELKELEFSIERLKDLKKKRERRQKLLNIVDEMQKRGISISIGKFSFLENNAKDAGEKKDNNSKIDKKRQQA